MPAVGSPTITPTYYSLDIFYVPASDPVITSWMTDSDCLVDNYCVEYNLQVIENVDSQYCNEQAIRNYFLCIFSYNLDDDTVPE